MIKEDISNKKLQEESQQIKQIYELTKNIIDSTKG